MKILTYGKLLEQAVNRREEQNNGFKNRNILLLETKAFLPQRTQRKPEKKVISPQFSVVRSFDRVGRTG